jgi:hypothetical protein
MTGPFRLSRSYLTRVPHGRFVVRRYRIRLLHGLPWLRQQLSEKLRTIIVGDDFSLSKFRYGMPKNPRTYVEVDIEVAYDEFGTPISQTILREEQRVGQTDLEVRGVGLRIWGESIPCEPVIARIEGNVLRVELDTRGRFGARFLGGALGSFGGSVIGAVVGGFASLLSLIQPVTSSAVNVLNPFLLALIENDPAMAGAFAGLLSGATLGLAIGHYSVWPPHAKAQIEIELTGTDPRVGIRVQGTTWPNTYVQVFYENYLGSFMYSLWRAWTRVPPSHYDDPLYWDRELSNGPQELQGEQIDGEVVDIEEIDENQDVDVSSTRVVRQFKD